VRRNLLKTVQRFADPAVSQLQQNVKDAVETLASDHDIISVPVQALAASGAALAGRSLVLYQGAPGATVTLPAAASQGTNTGDVVIVLNRSTGAIAVAAAPTDTIGGLLSVTLVAAAALILASDGVHEWFVPASGSGAGAWTDFTKDLGTSDKSGHFDITGLSGLTTGKNVAVMQTAQPIASKGNARDEFEFDDIQLTGYVVDASTIRCYWNAKGVVVGTYAFAYQVGA
jgi:hypothetical protein